MLREGVWLKRYRCPICGTIIRMRPTGYFPRFQSPIKTILRSIKLKESKDKWIKGVSRSRQQHWFKGLKRRVVAVFGNALTFGLAEAFELFAGAGAACVSRAI